jgi:hypothetical protein
MVESCIVIVFLCLLFLGLFQLVHAFVAREVLYHAAARAGRAKSVGFNQWMVEKTMRVAAIPNAGRLVEPAISTADPTLANALATLEPGQVWDYALQSSPRSAAIDIELARIPEYLASRTWSESQTILDYENWNSIQHDTIGLSAGIALTNSAAGTITMRVRQRHDLLLALADLMQGEIGNPLVAPTGTNSITLIGRYDIEAHYPLYLEDRNW